MKPLEGPMDLQSLLFSARGDCSYIVEEHDIEFTYLRWYTLRNNNTLGFRIDEIKRCKIQHSMRTLFNLPELAIQIRL